MLAAIKRLDDEARRVERSADGPPFADMVAEERRLSHSFAGRSVFGWETPEARGDFRRPYEPARPSLAFCTAAFMTLIVSS
jgi:hypothetical protein